ncbi:MAG: polysaccharide deacetylase family protein [Deltaproteobacteria bacterium]|nr:polysaccharide deacetylase family protein [Deltaproteobacteria bacterium]
MAKMLLLALFAFSPTKSGSATTQRVHHGTPHRGIPLAVTMDDLPFVGALPPDTSAAEGLAQIVRSLVEHAVPATGFAVCKRLDEHPGAISAWIHKGLQVGNHSTSHIAADDLSVDAFLDDVRRCKDRLTKEVGVPPRFFRYPYLRTGANREKRNAIFDGIRQMAQVRAPVSIDTADWLLADAYADALKVKDTKLAAQIADAYVQHVRLAARHYRRVAERRIGRPIAQILLLHANALAVHHLAEVLDMLEEEGFRFVPLAEALSDPAYAMVDDWVDVVGASWLYRIAPATKEAWAWDRGQERAMEARFGLRAEGAWKIGKALFIRRLDNLPVWVVRHEDPISANSLVVETKDGTPVLADTPWTPDATEDLLDWVELRFGKVPALASISHFHLDAAGGIEALRARKIPVVASRKTVALIRTKADAMRKALIRQHGEAFEGWSIAAPANAFDPQGGFDPRAGYRASVGGTRVEVLFPGEAHAPDNTVTWFPDTGVLFGGCLVKGGASLGYLGDANLDQYPRAVKFLQDLHPRWVVAGHGDRIDVEQLDNTRALISKTLIRDPEVPGSRERERR